MDYFYSPKPCLPLHIPRYGAFFCQNFRLKRPILQTGKNFLQIGKIFLQVGKKFSLSEIPKLLSGSGFLHLEKGVCIKQAFIRVFGNFMRTGRKRANRGEDGDFGTQQGGGLWGRNKEDGVTKISQIW